MTLILFTLLLWAVAVGLGWTAASRGGELFWGGVRDAADQMVFVAPRIVVGVIGAGFIAELLPPETVRALLGADSGLLGLLIAAALGAAIPGGPALVYAVGGAALAAGAGGGQVIAFTTSWLLLSLNRTMVWEAPIMGGRYARERILFALPLPLLIGWLAL